MAETGTESGVGTATGQGGGGDIEIKLDNKTYKGTWAFAQSGGIGTSFGSFGGASFNAMSVTAGAGEGLALLKASDGSGLRCRFAFSPLTQAGFGKCINDAGKAYDAQIRT